MRKLLTNNILYKLIALVFAMLLWLVVVNISDPTVTRTISGIPVERVDESVLTEQGKIYVVVEGNTASISVKGPRSIVDKLDSDDFRAEAPFGEITNLNAVPIYVSHKYPKYEKNVEITQKTRTMVLSIEDIVTKYFDIGINYIGEPASGYSLGSYKLSSSIVKLSAPKSIIDKIETASVDVDVTKIKGNMQLEGIIKYYDESGDKVELGDYCNASRDSVGVEVFIYQMTDIPLVVSATGSPAVGYECTGVELSKSSISVEGEDISSIDSITLPNDLLDITDAKEDVVKDIDISQYLPSDIRLVNDDDKNITVTAKIEKHITKVVSVPIGNFVMSNLSDEYEATFLDEKVTVTLVDLASVVDEINEDNIRGYVDMSGVSEGKDSLEIHFTSPENIKTIYASRVRVGVVKKETETTKKEKETTKKNTEKKTKEDKTDKTTEEENSTEESSED